MPSTRRVTINDVAAAAGVSRAAVSKVYNGRPGIPAATSTRIRDAADRLGWAPSSSAAALASARTRTIGLVVSREPDLLAVDPHFAVLIAGIEGVLARRGFGLQLHMVGESPEAELDTYRRITRERRVDGVLLTENRISDPRYGVLRELKLPFVLLGRPMVGQDIPAVYPEVGDQGATEAAKYLHGLGHEVIAYVAGPEDRVHTVYRRAAFEAALSVLGGKLSYSVCTSFNEDEAASGVLALMSLDPRPTAIVMANDSMAIAAIGALQRHGLRVPAEVSVLGHDDLPFSQWIHPRLTTISQDLSGLGRAGALKLLSVLDRHPETTPEVTTSQLVVRESTAAPPQKSRH